jgi:hypothetical protein
MLAKPEIGCLQCVRRSRKLLIPYSFFGIVHSNMPKVLYFLLKELALIWIELLEGFSEPQNTSHRLSKHSWNVRPIMITLSRYMRHDS